MFNVSGQMIRFLWNCARLKPFCSQGYGSKLKTWGTTDFSLVLVLTIQLLVNPMASSGILR